MKRLITRQEARPHSVTSLFFISLFVGCFRAFEELFFFKANIDTVSILGYTVFYYALGWALIALISLCLPHYNFKRIQNVMQLGLFIGLLPPIIDLPMALSGVEISYSYFYFPVLEKVPWFFYDTALKFRVSETVPIWLAIFFVAYYIHLKSRSWLKMAFGLLGAYVIICFFFLALPSLLVWFALGNNVNYDLLSARQLSQINQTTLLHPYLHFICAIISYLLIRPQLFAHLGRRLLHIVPFMMATLLGGAMAGGLTAKVFLAALIIGMLFYFAIVQNDFYDRFEDKRRPKRSGIEKADVEFFLFTLLLFFAYIFILKQPIFLPLALFFLLSYFYNHPRYRLKKYFPGGLKVEGLWAGLAFASGAITYQAQNWSFEIVCYFFLLAGGWSLVAALKDFKDIRADFTAGNSSFYLFMHRKGVKISRSHRILSLITLASLLVAPAYHALLQNWFGSTFLIGLVILFALLLARPSLRNWFQYVLAFLSVYLGVLVYISTF